MNDKLISIIMPIYNCEKYLMDSISSVLEQSYRNIELLLIDNGSTDKSKEIISKICDERIKVLELNIANVSRARNVGIENANGEYILFVDADDSLELDAIEILVDAADKMRCDTIIFDYNKCKGKKKELQQLPYSNKIFDKKFIKDVIIADLISTKVWGSVWRLFVKRTIILEKNIKFKENIKIAEDLLFNIELFNKLDKVYVLNRALYNYNVNVNSSLNRYKKDNFYINSNFHNELKSLLMKEKIYNKYLDDYKKNRIVMYTSSISNAVRNKNIKDVYLEVRSISKQFREDELNYKDISKKFSINFTLFLLQYKLYILLILLYKVKEMIRLRKI